MNDTPSTPPAHPTLAMVIDQAKGRPAGRAFCFGCHLVPPLSHHTMVCEEPDHRFHAYVIRTDRAGLAFLADLCRELALLDIPFEREHSTFPTNRDHIYFSVPG